MEKESIFNVDRENESLMQEGVVSQEEFNAWENLKPVYGEKTTKTAQQIVNLLNGLTIEEANVSLDLARGYIKRHSVIQINQ